jgi:hypothetical protein
MKTQIEVRYEETELALAHVLKEQARADAVVAAARRALDRAKDWERAADAAVAEAVTARQKATDEYFEEKYAAATRAAEAAESELDRATRAFATVVDVRTPAAAAFSAEIGAGAEPTVVDSGGIAGLASASDLPSPSPTERRMFTFRITSCETKIENYSKWFQHLGLPLRGWSFGELALRLHPGSVVVNSCPTWAYVRTPQGDYELESTVV